MLGKYQVRGVLGKGAMGVVYDGWDPDIDRRVAIKVVRFPPADDEHAREAIARVRREPKAVGRLNHPNIVNVYDYGETGGETPEAAFPKAAYIVLEFVPGRTLEKLLAADGRMPPERAVALVGDVLAGLAYSHAHSVLHRDIKPANIIVGDDGHAKIADFGIARIESSSLTRTGTVMGTPAYMSPEQFTGEPVDGRTDIYSCGIILYQLLTGDRPFDGGTAQAILHKVLTLTPPSPSTLSITAPAWLDPVVARAIARRPADRFASAAEFADALRPGAIPPAAAALPDADGEATLPAHRPTARPDADPEATLIGSRRPPGGKRRLPLLLLGGVAAAAVLAGAYVYVLQKPPPDAGSKQAMQTLPTPPPDTQPHPKPLSPATVDPAAIEAALAGSLASSRCSLTTETTAPDGAVSVSGIVGAGAAQAALRSAVAASRPTSTDWRVVAFDGPYCPALDLLRPLADLHGGRARLAFGQVGGPAPLYDNDLIPVRLTMPDFAGYVHIAYLQHDSTVAPQVPSGFYPQQTYAARQTVEFGRNRPDFDGWRVGPPFGVDMVVVVASTAPLFAAPLPDTLTLGSYLQSLGTATDGLRRRGASVAAAAILIDTRAR